MLQEKQKPTPKKQWGWDGCTGKFHLPFKIQIIPNLVLENGNLNFAPI